MNFTRKSKLPPSPVLLNSTTCDDYLLTPSQGVCSLATSAGTGNGDVMEDNRVPPAEMLMPTVSIR